MNGLTREALLAKLLDAIHEDNGKSLATVGVEASVEKAIEQIREYQKTERLARAVARSKGRYHSQIAICDLMDHYGLPNTRPETSKK